MRMKQPKKGLGRSAYVEARTRYAEWGVDTDAAIRAALAVPVSMHCWQVDDVGGFEVKEAPVGGGGLLATGHHSGRARDAGEARADFEKVLSLVPGVHRLNLHACYAETGGRRVERDELAPEHFAGWMAWGRRRGVKLDFNPTLFAHRLADDGYTLSHPDAGVRQFWIRHVVACRRIAEAMGRAQGSPCRVNHWIPDGAKDYPADRWSYRARLVQALDRALVRERSVSKTWCHDYVESKLFGLGSEEFVVGSSEFYSSYALSRGLGYCLDMGHWHPTEEIYDKISAYLQFHRRLLLHVSRPMRWDSDHVVLFNDALRHVFLEIQRGRAWARVALATDYFDASINRVAAYVIGLRATRKAILYALLDPTGRLQALERAGDLAARLAVMDEMKTMPFGAVWDRLCAQAGVAEGTDWISEVQRYEGDVLDHRM